MKYISHFFAVTTVMCLIVAVSALPTHAATVEHDAPTVDPATIVVSTESIGTVQSVLPKKNNQVTVTNTEGKVFTITAFVGGEAGTPNVLLTQNKKFIIVTRDDGQYIRVLKVGTATTDSAGVVTLKATGLVRISKKAQQGKSSRLLRVYNKNILIVATKEGKYLLRVHSLHVKSTGAIVHKTEAKRATSFRGYIQNSIVIAPYTNAKKVRVGFGYGVSPSVSKMQFRLMKDGSFKKITEDEYFTYEQ